MNARENIAFNEKTLFFFGAGASVDAGLPMAKGLYEKIDYHLGGYTNNTNIKENWQSLFNKIYTHCDNDIEETMSVIKHIGDHSSDISLLLDLLELASTKPLAELTDDCKNLFAFVNETLQEIFRITDGSKVVYLKKFVTLAQYFAINLFTLNYDDAVEVAAKKFSINLFDGCSEDATCNYPLFKNSFLATKSGINLYKLHGSIQWHIDVLSYSPRIMHSAESLDLNFTRPAMIFGKRDKLRADGFFLDILLAFKQKLALSDTLCVVGYSFGDEHINKFMSQWWQSDSSRQVLIVDPMITKTQKIPDQLIYGKKILIRGNRDYIDIFPKAENKMVIPIEHSSKDFFELFNME